MALANKQMALAQLRGEKGEQAGAGEGHQKQRRFEQGTRRPALLRQRRELPLATWNINYRGDCVPLEYFRRTVDHPAACTCCIFSAKGQLQVFIGNDTAGSEQLKHVCDD